MLATDVSLGYRLQTMKKKLWFKTLKVHFFGNMFSVNSAMIELSIIFLSLDTIHYESIMKGPYTHPPTSPPPAHVPWCYPSYVLAPRRRGALTSHLHRNPIKNLFADSGDWQ